VVLPWSTWAMMAMLRMFWIDTVFTRGLGTRPNGRTTRKGGDYTEIG
jgi:hypothetical protein